MILLLCHSYLHFLDRMIFWRVKKLGFVADPNQIFQNFSVYGFELKEVVSDHIMGALKILEILNLSSFHEQDSIKLWKQSI